MISYNVLGYLSVINNGLMIQFGKGLGTSGHFTVTLPISFSNTDYKCICGDMVIDGVGGRYIHSKTISSFQSWDDTRTTAMPDWLVIGY